MKYWLIAYDFEEVNILASADTQEELKELIPCEVEWRSGWKTQYTSDFVIWAVDNGVPVEVVARYQVTGVTNLGDGKKFMGVTPTGYEWVVVDDEPLLPKSVRKIGG